MIKGLGKALAETRASAKMRGKSGGSTKFWIGCALLLVTLLLLTVSIPTNIISMNERKSGNFFEPEEIARRDETYSAVMTSLAPILILVGIILMIKGEVQKSEERKEESEVE